MRERDYEDMPQGICSRCGNGCTATWVDFGIGPYEFWGSRGNHHDYQVVSPCCEALMEEGGETVVRKSVHVARKDHGDGKIKAGERYELTVLRHWRKDGPWWITTEKRKLAS